MAARGDHMHLRKSRRYRPHAGDPLVRARHLARNIAVHTGLSPSAPASNREISNGVQAPTFHVDQVNAEEVTPIVRENLAKEAHLMTDTARWFRPIGRELARHETVDHSWEEYVRDVTDPKTGEEYKIHVNTLEGYFSIFKRGMKGIYQHCSEKHLHRYLAECDFRYNNRIALGVNDYMRAELAAKGIVGKRLTYRRPHGAPYANDNRPPR
jgi:ISXO2-like transposase domain